MSVNIQHKLLQFELPPPEGTWENISRRLDAEFDVSETKASQKIYEANLEAPSFAWQNIMEELDTTESRPEKSSKVVPLFSLRRLAIAAVITGLLMLGGWFVKQSGRSVGVATAITEATPAQPGDDAKKNANDLIDTQDLSSAVAQLVPRKTVTSEIRQNVQLTAAYEIESVETTDIEVPEPRTIIKQNPHVIDATEDALVAAPSIRDAKGKLIMDMSLLISQSGNYITVTGPNGEQTRISSKFARFLSYLNSSNNDKEDYLDFLIRRNYSWKYKFEEWRTKILQHASFAPSGSNFFDILELKDLIEEGDL
jgi:hypothetical protein